MKSSFLNNIIIIIFFWAKLIQVSNNSSIPLVINTWNYHKATIKAWEKLLTGHNYLDAIEAGCSVCEHLQCDETVGYGGNTDENGESTLDAQIFDGATMDMGAVGGLRRIKNAISVARRVLDSTHHSLLVGDLATRFAVKMGFKEECLITNKSLNDFCKWKANNCCPHFRKRGHPDACGPTYLSTAKKNVYDDIHNHDTIGMIVIDKDHNIVAGTTTNGPKFKIPGRVGDSPIPGAGAYADNCVGAAVATGNGDVMMRFLPSFLAVEEMRRGKTPLQAATIAMERITEKHPNFFGALIVVRKDGKYAAVCSGMEKFPISLANPKTRKIIIKQISCKKATSVKKNDSERGSNTCQSQPSFWGK